MPPEFTGLIILDSRTLAAATNASWGGNRTIRSCIHNYSCSSLWAEADGLSRAAPLCLSDYPPWNLSLPLDSLGLAAIYDVKGHCVAQKQLLQLTQMCDWLWRDTTEVFWCMKDEPSLDLLSECINDVCVQLKSALPHKAKHNSKASKSVFRFTVHQIWMR